MVQLNSSGRDPQAGLLYEAAYIAFFIMLEKMEELLWQRVMDIIKPRNVHIQVKRVESATVFSICMVLA